MIIYSNFGLLQQAQIIQNYDWKDETLYYL